MAEFTNLCTQFERTVRAKYKDSIGDDSPFYFIENRKEYQMFRDELEIMRKLRNNFAHEPHMINNQAVLEVADVTYDALKRIIKYIENPPTVEDRYIPAKNLLTTHLNEPIKDVIEKMRKKSITHVPVLNEDGKLIGVFSENTIFSRLCDDEIVAIDENEAIEKCCDYLPIDKHESEYFEFVGLKTTIADVKSKFDNPINKNKRLVLLIVTKTGRDNQKIEGVISPWDLIND